MLGGRDVDGVDVGVVVAGEVGGVVAATAAEVEESLAANVTEHTGARPRITRCAPVDLDGIRSPESPVQLELAVDRPRLTIHGLRGTTRVG